MATSYDTQATSMEERPNQSVTTITASWPTNPGHVELQVLPASFPSAAKPIPSDADADLDDPKEDYEDAPLRLGFKLTGYRLLNIVLVFTIGMAKFILSLKGQPITPTGLEWAGGLVLVIL